ncbi:MAG: hypothetical protein ABH824_07515 [Nanoarchaeota archaeon]|nr:hypothetical protein [Nanoarchaeota archaeon]MBU1632616.1 hypothetical protein [Nanoarchaeota archaeon]MBU1876449.1 hypothetical protein [Nanoarchaeota archaeon]
MDWEKCTAEKTIRKVEPDKERIRNMLKMIEVRQKFWDSLIDILDDEFSSLIVEGYYEIIKELLTAYLNINGLESSNHECLIRYFQKENSNLNVEAEKIDELKQVRNKIDYRGFFVRKEFFERNKLEYQHIIKLLNKMIKEKI